MEGWPALGGKVWELTVNVLVFSPDNARVLLLRRTKEPLVGWWLPPGGHVEPGERPDAAAEREVCEETGLRVRLVDGRPDLPLSVDDKVRRVLQPHHIQLEPIDDRHDHLDLIYVAYPEGEAEGSPAPGSRWCSIAEMLADDRVPENVKVAAGLWLQAVRRARTCWPM